MLKYHSFFVLFFVIIEVVTFRSTHEMLICIFRGNRSKEEKSRLNLAMEKETWHGLTVKAKIGLRIWPI